MRRHHKRVGATQEDYNRRVDPLKILYVCIGNSCRSPMAEAMTRSLGGDRVEARSAGLAPLGWIAEPTIAVLEARGFSTDGLSSKGLEAVAAVDLDVVVSLIGDHGLNVLPPGMGVRREAWPIPDPFGEDEVFYLEVARQLEGRIRRLLGDELRGELLLP